ncbi:MAG: hypothetical protein AB8B59_17020 [Maribacter sp.]
MIKINIKLGLLLVITAIIWSCNELPKKERNLKKQTAKTEKAIKKEAQDKLYKRLRKTKPIDVAELETWTPKTLGGLSLERTKRHSIFGEVQMIGFYKRKGDKIINLNITDAAGPNGEMAADKINVFGTEREYDVENQQHRSVNVKGRMARQSYVTDKNMTMISFFHKKRFMIMITAHDHSVKETWGLVDELDFNALDNLTK